MNETASDTIPDIAHIQQALHTHVLGGPSPDAVIRAALRPVGDSLRFLSTSPGKGRSRPTYALEIPALGLKIERRSVAEVAKRLHTIATALAPLSIGAQAPPEAPEFLLATPRSSMRIRAVDRPTLQEALRAITHSKLISVYAPIETEDLHAACQTGVAWSRHRPRIPPGPLRLTEEIRWFLDRARLEAALTLAAAPAGAAAFLSLTLTAADTPAIDASGTSSNHARLTVIDRLQALARTLVRDRDTWLAGALPRSPESPLRDLRLTIAMKDRDGSPDIRLRIMDADCRRVAPAHHDDKAELRLDSATLAPRALLHALDPAEQRRWILDISASEGSAPKLLTGADLTTAMAVGTNEQSFLDHAALCRTLGAIAAHRSADSAHRLAFAGPPPRG